MFARRCEEVFKLARFVFLKISFVFVISVCIAVVVYEDPLSLLYT